MNNAPENNFQASTIERGVAAAGVFGMTAAAFALRYFNPSTAGFFPACPLYTLTGLACPGCGLTRAMHAFLHGDIAAALDYNLLLPAILFLGGFLFVTLLLIAVRGRGFDFKIFSPSLVWFFFAFALIFGVVRNLPFYPFTVLFP
jgi:hypothetical protein